MKALTNSDRGEHYVRNLCPIQQQACDMIVALHRDADPSITQLLILYLKEHHDAFERAAGCLVGVDGLLLVGLEEKKPASSSITLVSVSTGSGL